MNRRTGFSSRRKASCICVPLSERSARQVGNVPDVDARRSRSIGNGDQTGVYLAEEMRRVYPPAIDLA
jgi:hypothetical protein